MRWWLWKNAWWRRTAEFRPCVRNVVHRIILRLAVFASSPTWYADRSRWPCVQCCNWSLFSENFLFQGLFIPKSWALFRFTAVTDAVFLRSARALRYLNFEHHQQDFAPFLIAKVTNLTPWKQYTSLPWLREFLQLANCHWLKITCPLSNALIWRTSDGFVFNCLAKSNHISSWRNYCYNNSQSAPNIVTRLNHVIGGDVMKRIWLVF